MIGSGTPLRHEGMKLVANRRSTRPNEPIDRGMSQLKQSAETIGAEGPPYLSSAEHPGGVELDRTHTHTAQEIF